MSGGVLPTSARPQPAPGPSELAPGQPLGDSTSTPERWSVDRELNILWKVEELIRVQTQESRQKAAFIHFLHEVLPSIDDDLFPEYFDHVVRYTQKFVDESKRCARQRAQGEEDEEEDVALQDSEGAARGQPPSLKLACSELEDEDDDSDLTGEVVDPDYDLPAGPSLLGVSSVHRGPTGKVMSYGPAAKHWRTLPLMRPRPSAQSGRQLLRTGSGPQTSTLSAMASVPYSMGSSSGQHVNVALSGQRYQEQFTHFATQYSVPWA